MKHLVGLLALVSLSAGSGIPQVPGDNSHYVEGQSRWIWMPDGDGVPHLVDLHEPIDESQSDSRNGARNQYFLFTRRNRYNFQTIIHGDVNSIRNSNYNANRPLMVIVHGWNSDRNSRLNPLIRDAYLAVEDANVIVVDWNRVSGRAYRYAVREVPNIGQYLGNFLQWLVSNTGTNWNRVHLVGFSLGAHIVGNAGRKVNRRPVRITGLDPAGPQWGGNFRALSYNDGGYVECIHTDGGTLGIFDPICRANFYPNGGRSQPGCWVNTCFHSRAYELFASSLRTPNRFVGRRCNNLQDARRERCNGTPTLYMGNSNLSKRGYGLFGLTTGNRYPF